MIYRATSSKGLKVNGRKITKKTAVSTGREKLKGTKRVEEMERGGKSSRWMARRENFGKERI